MYLYHSGLFQNEETKVCEDCDYQCLGGCIGGIVSYHTFVQAYRFLMLVCFHTRVEGTVLSLYTSI